MAKSKQPDRPRPPQQRNAKTIPRERPPRRGQRDMQAESKRFGALVKKAMGD